MSSVSTALDAVRQPAYVGENRCIPCTLVNSVIALALAALAWVVVTPEVGVLVVVVSALAIGLRGYLVPGTPTLTKRYLPEPVLAYFDKAPATATTASGDADTVPREDIDVEEILVGAGILVPCEARDDLCLRDEFRESWYANMDAVNDDDATPAAVADLLDVDVSGLSLEDHGEGAFMATFDGVRVGQWESRAALIADVAAADLVAERDDDWDERPIAVRGELLGGLRLFLETCPDCRGAVSFGRETVESCCRSHEVVAVSCDDCGARLFEAAFEG